MTNEDRLREALAFYINHWDCDYETRKYHGCYTGPDSRGGHPIFWLKRALSLPTEPTEAKCAAFVGKESECQACSDRKWYIESKWNKNTEQWIDTRVSCRYCEPVSAPQPEPVKEKCEDCRATEHPAPEQEKK